MQVKINDEWKTFPSSLQEITLKQKIDYHNEHGKLLEEMAASILDMKDEMEQEIEMALFQLEQMFRTFAFFANTTVEAIKESEFIDKVANIYYANMTGLLQQEQVLDLELEFEWNGEKWFLSNPELKHGDRMKFEEFIDSKQIIQDMIGLGKSRWECLIPLAAIFLRRENEEYEESFLFEGSERLKLMETLPLNIALQVAFFLSGSLNIYTETFLSSFPQGQKALERMSQNTSSSLDG